ncbi:MAG: ABC transporter ATP-binding protein [Puniceicoccales bacterium]|jgi:lipoprotein-releasing system ATP-binding protein|nr:ABC transporter ATP-binding protein [Puniceicoccales bacterium]
MPHLSPIVSLENISQQFHSPDGQIVSVLQNIFFAIEPNQTVSISGESGSGKSTLLHLIGGLDVPSSGSILWKGKYTSGLSIDQLAAQRQSFMGFIFQNPNLIPELTVLENILLPIRIAGKNLQHYLPRSVDLLHQLHIHKQTKQIPEKLSGGERQRVAIARALILNPELIVADEPTGNLDEKNANITIELLLNLCQKYHSALILVTHNITLAQKMQQSFVLKSGRLKAVHL